MPTMTDEALVLDSRPNRDRDILLSVLTREQGLQRGVFRRSRGGRAPRTATTQVLSRVRCSLYRGPNAELASFREIELITSSYPLAKSIENASAANVIAEILLIFCPENEPAPRRFRLGTSLLDALLAGMNPEAAIAYGQVWALKLGGLFPAISECAGCGVLLGPLKHWRRSDPHLYCTTCVDSGPKLTATDLEFLNGAAHQAPEQLSSRPSTALRSWLDAITRHVAESPLRALEFHRRHATHEGP